MVLLLAVKSTVAKIIAKKLGYIYLDTGAMYRSATYLALQNDTDLTDERAIVKLLKDYPISFGRRKDDSEQLVLLAMLKLVILFVRMK